MISYKDYIKYAEEFDKGNQVTQEHADKCDAEFIQKIMLKIQKDNND